MTNYESPVMIRTEELAEGVYLASGGIKCDSVYMNGVWQAPDYSDWNGYWTKLPAQVAGGQTPDVFQMDYAYLSVC